MYVYVSHNTKATNVWVILLNNLKDEHDCPEWNILLYMIYQ